MAGYTYDEDIFSDLYKETYGFRPRGHEFYDADPATKQRIWDSLLSAHEAEMRDFELRQKHAAEEFELAVATAKASGGRDRATAVRWLVEAATPAYMQEDSWNQKLGYVEYDHDLPYGYLNEFRTEGY